MSDNADRWVALEYAGEDDAIHGRRGIERPTDIQPFSVFGDIFLEMIRKRRPRWMQPQRGIKLDHALVEMVEIRVIRRLGSGTNCNIGAEKTELFHGSMEFRDHRVRIDSG